MVSAGARAGVYRRIATLEKAGIGLRQGIERLAGQGGAGAELLGPVRARLVAGKDAAEAFIGAPGFTNFESRLIAAGAKSGNLPDTFIALADHMEERVRTQRTMVMALAYPLFLIHLAVFLPQLKILFERDGGLVKYLLWTVVPLGTAWLVVAGSIAGWIAFRKGAPAQADRLLLQVPVLGGVLRDRALAATIRVLRLTYGSGIPLATAVEAAAEACPNRHLAAIFERARPRVAGGEPLSAALVDARELPELVLDMISSGETAGELAELLEKAEQELTASAQHRQKLLIGAATVAVFLFAAAMVALQVISGFLAYTNKINELVR